MYAESRSSSYRLRMLPAAGSPVPGDDGLDEPIHSADLALVLAAQRGEPRARARLIQAHVRLIAAAARAYRFRGIEHRELMQAGVVGLLRALERFDPAFGAPLWAYAKSWVRREMQQLVSELGGPVVLSDRAQRQLARVHDAQRTHRADHAAEPTSTQVAKATGLTVIQVDRLLSAARASRGLEDRLGGEHPSGTMLGDTIVDPRAEQAYEGALTRIAAEQVPALLGRLDARERIVVRARYGFDGPVRTLHDVGDELGISAERVRQIEHRAIEELREERIPMPA